MSGRAGLLGRSAGAGNDIGLELVSKSYSPYPGPLPSRGTEVLEGGRKDGGIRIERAVAQCAV